MATLFDSMTPN